MGQPGLNVPRDGSIPAQTAAFLGARWLRVVLLPDVDLTPWIEDAHARKLKVLGVIARESLVGRYDETAFLYAARYGNLDAVQGGNESDHHSPSSWDMEPSDLNDLLAAINLHFPHTPIVGPGLVSGNPHYLDAVDLDLVDAISVHPYGRWPNNQDWSELPGGFGSIAGLLDAYRYHGKPIWITELGVSTHQVSAEFQARYVSECVKSLKLRTDVPVVCWFALHDHDGFGLQRDDGSLKPSATAFLTASGHHSEPEPMPILKAIDVSSHQPKDLTDIIAQHQPQHVIVKIYTSAENIPFSHTAAQVASAKANGCTVGGYVWAYRSVDPIRTIDDVVARCASINLVLPLLWIDCETYDGPPFDPGPDANWLARAVDHAENTYGMKCGIYTGQWWIRGHFPGGEPGFAQFSRLPLWLSEYDNDPNIDNADTIPQGWASLAAKQYSADGIDLNSIRSEYTVYQGGDEPEPIDPCAHFRQQLEAWRDAKPYRAPSKAKITALLA